MLMNKKCNIYRSEIGQKIKRNDALVSALLLVPRKLEGSDSPIQEVKLRKEAAFQMV